MITVPTPGLSGWPPPQRRAKGIEGGLEGPQPCAPGKACLGLWGQSPAGSSRGGFRSVVGFAFLSVTSHDNATQRPVCPTARPFLSSLPALVCPGWSQRRLLGLGMVEAARGGPTRGCPHEPSSGSPPRRILRLSHLRQKCDLGIVLPIKEAKSGPRGELLTVLLPTLSLQSGGTGI